VVAPPRRRDSKDLYFQEANSQKKEENEKVMGCSGKNCCTNGKATYDVFVNKPESFNFALGISWL
jgi:hypothetical protein